MRVLFLGNNWLGWQTLRWLREQGTELVGAVLHPEGRRQYGDELVEAAALPPDRIFDGTRLREPGMLDAVRALQPDLGVSVMFAHILRAPFLDVFSRGVVNLHPALLPWNRGTYANVWSIVDRTPAGVTFHRIDAGVDTGEILAQREVAVSPTDTGESLYRKLERAGFALFQQAWPQLLAGELEGRPQPEGGSEHRLRDVAKIDRIDLDANVRAGDLIDLLRARTFPPYKGAYFEVDGRRVYLRLALEEE